MRVDGQTGTGKRRKLRKISGEKGGNQREKEREERGRTMEGGELERNNGGRGAREKEREREEEEGGGT